MSIVWTIAAVIGGLLLACLLYLGAYSAWWSYVTAGLRYYGRPIEERREIKARVARVGVLVPPLLRIGFKALSSPERLEVWQGGLCFPRSACSKAAIAHGLAFQPAAGDVFVATQMKCGTTWMQQIVYEIFSRGRGDLGDQGHVHLNAMSPWLESSRGVSMEDAPRIGPERARIIKTHLPASHCPYSKEAKYIYVTRHPVSCYLSCLEFTATNGGPLVREGAESVAWFCSERMWWGSWPKHVEGWWAWAAERPNVLFVHFEAMKDDLRATVLEVARFLGITLAEAEVDAVVEKSSFAAMRDREEWFEMSPPTVFSAGKTLFKSGSATRHAEVDKAAREQIVAFCKKALAGSVYPASRYYPDLGERLSGDSAP